MTYHVDTGQIREHANAVGGVEGNLRAMSDAGAPDPDAYGELLKALGLPSFVSGSVDSVWDAINTAHTGTGQVENGLRFMATRYDADDDLAAFMLKPTIPVMGPAPSGGGGGGGASINASYAATPSERSVLSGAGILDSGSTTIQALCDGNWVDAALSGVSTVLDAAATVVDPLGSLLAAGIGWAIDHLDPIKGWFDDVTGSPEAVAAKGESWGNIADGMEPLAQSWETSVNTLIGWMSGDAISSYKAQATARIETLRKLKGSSEGAKEALGVVSAIVSFVHSFLRDILASLVGAILSWVAQTVLSLGTLIPWVIGQIGTRIASVVAKCSRYITALTRSGTELGSLLKALKGFADDILKFLNKITPNPNLVPPRHAAPPGPPVPAGPWRPPPGYVPPPRGDHAATPLDGLADIPGQLPWRDSAVNAGTQSGQNATPDED